MKKMKFLEFNCVISDLCVLNVLLSCIFKFRFVEVVGYIFVNSCLNFQVLIISCLETGYVRI